jgi:transposase
LENNCEATNNKHFKWFARLLKKNHHEGICNYASYQITTCKVEGTNIMIKTLRRRNYGIPDDVYLFLKVMDESRW